MPLLTLSNISKAYGSDPVLERISLKVQHGEKCGLIGPNASGKTTLLRIIAGELEADEGAVHLARGARIGYLPQQPHPLSEGSLRRHLEHPLSHVFIMKEEIETLEKAIANRAEKEGAALQEHLERYAELTERFEEEGGYLIESKLIGVAKGLGFSEADLGRDLSTFSGGEKTRARLAGLLLQEQDLLLLDEPTNFLDLDALQWLEKYLHELSCALIVVSHDRYFLDRAVKRIFALQGTKVKTYSGNYSAFQRQLNEELLNSERERRHLELIKAREERLVREAKGDERSQRQAKSRQKRLEKMDSVELPPREQNFKLGLGYSGRSGRQVAIFDRVGISYEGAPVFADLTFEIRWGDRIALVGPNGSGKTTLLKLISGELQPTSGSIRLGSSVRVTYFSQEQEQLDPHRSLLETITAASELDQKEARNHLGRYLFRGDDVFKRVSELSGGEKSRLALARLALNSGNCLLMDEPTSHLDLPALEEVENVLAGYPGTLVIVSHDRYFLKGLANRVFELGGGKLTIFERSFEEYLEFKESAVEKSRKSKDGKAEENKRRREENRRRQAEQREERRLKDEQARLEKAIEEKEAAVARLEKTLSDPAHYGDHHRLAGLGRELEEEKSELERLLWRWEELTARLEQPPH